MEIKSTDLISLFEKSLSDIADHKLDEIGFVVQVGDSSCRIHGLKNAVFGELIDFEGGNQGIIFNLDEDYVFAFLLYAHISVAELEIAKRTGGVFKTPVGKGLLGRIINAVAKPIDSLGALAVAEYRPIEVAIPGIIERSPINESLETGILAIDALVPIGKGQRELLIGNRDTGKTSIAIDTILHQKGKNVYCIYVAIGQRQANVARIARLLEDNGALPYTTIVSADASEPALNRYLAPYVACTMAEYLRDQKNDVLIVYDDLSNHAVAYREMSLLMRRSPGREAYPGDVFYIHSRLLERAGKLEVGGSITALPIVQVQGDDITAYIPTNLISITDGQIFLDTKLFKNGVRPAVNTELSVSRVGGAAQTKAIKQMSRSLKLELAQYQDLLAFSQFGTELDVVSQKRLAQGARIIELLKQEQYVTFPFADQALMLFLLRENFLEPLEIANVRPFALGFVSYVKSVYQDLYRMIVQTQEMTVEVIEQLKTIAHEFALFYIPNA
ncbi:MAG TPA: F0F1 ATP synthase subunit alpha [Candidatus Babeliaceae bacterium]|nr:F0F1 ATP synthase subunit alpha [Candidatus Babeliaceae bacterium]